MKVNEDTHEAKRYSELTKGTKETFHKLTEKENIIRSCKYFENG